MVFPWAEHFHNSLRLAVFYILAFFGIPAVVELDMVELKPDFGILAFFNIYYHIKAIQHPFHIGCSTSWFNFDFN